jgi:hypothetical protein
VSLRNSGVKLADVDIWIRYSTISGAPNQCNVTEVGMLTALLGGASTAGAGGFVAKLHGTEKIEWAPTFLALTRQKYRVLVARPVTCFVAVVMEESSIMSVPKTESVAT